jgi:hypothetical protein
MPRREILSPAQREALVVIPVDRAGLIEPHWRKQQVGKRQEVRVIGGSIQRRSDSRWTIQAISNPIGV